MPVPPRLGDGRAERHLSSHPVVHDPQHGKVQHGPRGDRRRQDQLHRRPLPVPVPARVWPDRELQPQQRPPRAGTGPVDRGLLPVACREQQHARSARRRLQLERVRRKPPLSGQETLHLPGPGPDDGGRDGLPARDRRADGVPLLRRPLQRLRRPRLEDSRSEGGPPARGPQQPPRLLLRHPHDPVIHHDAVRRDGAPAEAPQGHPRLRWQRTPRIVPTRRERPHVARVPVVFRQPGRHPPHQRGAPAHPLGHHRGSEVLACLLDSTTPGHDAGAGGPNCLAISRASPSSAPAAPIAEDTITSSIIPSGHRQHPQNNAYRQARPHLPDHPGSLNKLTSLAGRRGARRLRGAGRPATRSGSRAAQPQRDGHESVTTSTRLTRPGPRALRHPRASLPVPWSGRVAWPAGPRARAAWH